ncbi:MAG: HAD-IIIA family hydrolase [Phycisphaera sp.]|nr:HAD-IIIA family hydrolase [Phycisphaera sp.]
MQRAIFLDRDNTIIPNDGDLGDPAQVRLLQGAASAIASLQGLGYRIVVITNQGGVARGKYTPHDVEACHERLSELVRQTSGGVIDRYYYCPYHPEGTVKEYRREHPWRKPQPGMILQAAKDLDLDLEQCWTIGDQLRDVAAGKAAGTRTILLHPDARERPPLDAGHVEPAVSTSHGGDDLSKPDFEARNLIDAVKIVAQQRKPAVVEELRHVGGQRRPLPPMNEPVTPRKSDKPDPDARPSPQGSVKSAVEPSARKAPPQAGAISLRQRSVEMDTQTSPTQAPIAVETRSVLPQVSKPTASQARVPSVEDTPKDPVRAPQPEAQTEAQPEATSRSQSPESQDTLRLILQELRNHRAHASGSDFSTSALVAVVLEMIAVMCVVAGLTVASNSDGAFVRWLGVGVFVQLATIAVLLFRR